MSTLSLFKEYIWLVETIHKARKITLAELNERWLETEMSGGVTISRTTFYKHRCEVEELLRKAPERLFQLYLVNRYRFATHLYYSRLSQRAYDRLLTLLAVREAMLAKQETDKCDDDGRIARTIETLRQEGELKHLYDITWVMIGMNATPDLPSFDTPTSFLDYMIRIGVKKGLPTRSTVSKYYDSAHGEYPNWTFTDADGQEAMRRNNVIKRFLNLVKRE